MRKLAIPIVAVASFALSPAVVAQTEEPVDTEQVEPAGDPAPEPVDQPAVDEPSVDEPAPEAVD